jgi:hypothetical protein
MLSFKWLGRVRPIGGIARAEEAEANALMLAVTATAPRLKMSRLVIELMMWDIP